jgi:tripartite-type tricarboxylate transporter receptor subunit TctC
MKKILAAGMMVLASAGSAPALAQDFPNHPIRLIIPYSAGGVTDVVGRALAEQSGKRLGQTVVVENKTGANGTLGATQMLNTAPDGYTVTMVPIGIFRMPHISGTRYDPVKDLTYISMIAGYNSYVAVAADSPWKTLDDLVAYAKSKPDTISYGTPGAYSSQHIAMVQLGEAAQAKWTHVPYKGDADALTAMLGGHIQVLVGASTILPYVASGKVRILASLGDKRSPDLPDVPTLKEAGYPVVHTSPFGIAGPKDMDPAVIAKLDGAFRDTLKDEAFLALLRQSGVSPQYMDTAAYTKAAHASAETEREVIKKLGNIMNK